MKMKKICSLILAASMAVSLCACSSSSTAGTSAGTSAGTTNSKTFNLKLSHGLSKDHPIQKALQQFADTVKKKTNGSINIEIFPNATLGSENNNIEQIQNNALDMAKVSAATLENFSDIYSTFSVPYIFKDEKTYYSFMDSDEAQKIFDSTEKDKFIALTWFDSGARSFYTTKKAVNTPADLKGLKIRTMDSPMAISMMECFGASAATMSMSDIYTAMQSGVIDGAENNPTALTTYSHGEVSKYFCMDEHTRIPDMLVISTEIWNQFSKSQQKIVKSAAKEATESYKTLWNQATEESLKEAQNKYSVKVIHPNQELFRKACQPIYDKLKKNKPDVYKEVETIKDYKA